MRIFTNLVDTKSVIFFQKNLCMTYFKSTLLRLVFFIPFLFASYFALSQPGTQITYEDNLGPVTLDYNNDVNGKASYQGSDPPATITISWSGTRWEIFIDIGDGKGSVLSFSSAVETANNPPNFATGSWQDENDSDGTNLVNVSGSGTTNIILPVELVSFTRRILGNKVVLNWQTASEINNEGFEIERFTDHDFKTIGYISGNGTTSEKNVYQYTDANAATGIKSYYRLKQVDYNGRYEYSKIISAMVVQRDYHIYPNPTADVLYISHDTSYRIINSQGLVVLNGTANRVDVSKFPSGLYVIRLSDGSTEQFMKK